MIQPSLDFDGTTFNPVRDFDRLNSQLKAVKWCLDDGAWWSLAELGREAQGSTASVSARIRDLRKPKFGKHEIQRRYLRDGVWVYRHALESCCNA